MNIGPPFEIFFHVWVAFINPIRIKKINFKFSDFCSDSNSNPISTLHSVQWENILDLHIKKLNEQSTLVFNWRRETGKTKTSPFRASFLLKSFLSTPLAVSKCRANLARNVPFTLLCADRGYSLVGRIGCISQNSLAVNWKSCVRLVLCLRFFLTTKILLAILIEFSVNLYLIANHQHA